MKTNTIERAPGGEKKRGGEGKEQDMQVKEKTEREAFYSQ